MDWKLIDIFLVIIGALLSLAVNDLFSKLRKNASDIANILTLIMEEKEKAAALVKIEHDRLLEQITLFRLKVAEEYITTTTLEKIFAPLRIQLNELERLLHTKLDRRDFDKHFEEK